ncbi:MAG: c-type cytochrome [Sulfuricella sp.]|nr:c-type cytochrome [Sulfuricella sp.]
MALSPVSGASAAKKTAKPAANTPAAEAATANKPVTTQISAAIAALKADPETGRQINGVCAACHGDTGQGGKKGEYPRLAGQHVEYLMAQLQKFKGRHRTNLPMFPYTEERELPDEDIVHISAYLASITLDTAYPVFKDTDDALTRLLATEKVLNIPRSEGDVEAGAKLYKSECASCHGHAGMGKRTVPMLAGQYTVYLKRQIDRFIKGERLHDEDEKDVSKELLSQLKPEEIRDILAYLTTLDD